jgi:transposase
MADSPASPIRFVAINIRRHDALVGAVGADQQVVLAPCGVDLGGLESWLLQRLQPGDAVVIVSLVNAWQIHDTLAPLVASVIIAHPQLDKLLPGLHASNDSSDVLKLARLHAAGLVPTLWVPPQAVRDLRALTAHRRRLILQHADAARLLQNILRRYRLTPPGANRLGTDRPDWWAAQALPAHERAGARDALAALNRATNLLADVEERLQRQSMQEPWRATIDQMVAKVGMRRIYAIALVAAIGDIARFPSANQLVGYAGLAGDPHAGHSNGEAFDLKEGRREIRATMLDVAEVAIHADRHWREMFTSLEHRIGPQRAIVAIARKLLVVLWKALAIPASSAAPAVLNEQTTRRAA